MSWKTAIKRRLKIPVIVLLSWFILHQIIIISDGLVDEKQISEVAVIFGNTVNKDGSLSPRLKARLDKGVQLYNSKKVSKLFVSGGLGKEGHLEGSKMAEYLISKDISENVIVIDNEGNNTRLTAVNFKKHFPEVKSVNLVTQYHHVSRAKLAFRQIGIETVNGSHAEYLEMRDVYSCFREFFAYYSYLIKY